MKTSLRAAASAAIMMSLAYAAPAFASGEIVAPTSGVINSGGPGFGSLNDTINQAGLLTGYTSGVTDFNTYIAGNPQHNFVFSGNEWFSNDGTDSASVTYDMGSALGIDALALWNEDASGIGTLNLYGSLNGVLFTLLGTWDPADNPINFNYGPEVFSFTAGMYQYFQLDMSGCPQPPDNGFQACAIGEVAFRTADVGGIPEPATWGMMLLGFAGIGMAMRRRRSYRLAARLA